MDTWKITALLAAGVALAIIALLLRVRSDGKYEIKTVDLMRMEQLNTDSLPVFDDKHHFVGTVERGKLTSSLILSVTDKLEGRNAGAP
jgi:CBS-domain-containing membrane protein